VLMNKEKNGSETNGTRRKKDKNNPQTRNETTMGNTSASAGHSCVHVGARASCSLPLSLVPGFVLCFLACGGGAPRGRFSRPVPACLQRPPSFLPSFLPCVVLCLFSFHLVTLLFFTCKDGCCIGILPRLAAAAAAAGGGGERQAEMKGGWDRPISHPGSPVSHQTNQLINQSINQSSINQSINQSINSPINRSIARPLVQSPKSL
jgi:hypothetical protein